ncbi:MAG TPA: alpha/beta hydrolase [Streptosporangiaceae bacterium]|nr:alpha/beta hydrolase [Streptosporangiaceae bacterium]
MHDVLNRPAPAPDETVRYGPGPDHVASLWWPRAGAARTAPVVLFLHGGFWRAAWDRTHAGPLAVALAGAGFTVCAPEFRRTGAGDGGGWPGTFDDIAAAVDTLPGLLSDLGGPPADSGLVLAGHSAGGHLSLWAAARHRLPAGLPWHRAGPAPIRAVVALAAVSELTACYDEGLGDGAAGALIGGSPADHPDRYAVTDPARLLPIGIPLWLVHGALDDRVPAAMSRSFTGRARAAGDEVAARELPGGDHFDLIDPSSAAWPDVLGAFRAAAGPAGTA